MGGELSFGVWGMILVGFLVRIGWALGDLLIMLIGKVL